MSITTYHPTSLVELVPQLPPLADALTEEQHQLQLDEEQRQVRLHAMRELPLALHILQVIPMVNEWSNRSGPIGVKQYKARFATSSSSCHGCMYQCDWAQPESKKSAA